jgi:hypothetical protein
MVLQAIVAVERALNASKSERDGPGRRVDDALSRAAMSIGNGTDEYVEREIADTNRQRDYEAEIAKGRRRAGLPRLYYRPIGTVESNTRVEPRARFAARNVPRQLFLSTCAKYSYRVFVGWKGRCDR